MSTPTEEEWRGVAAEDNEELNALVGTRLQQRSRRLLGSLVRPRLGTALLALAMVVLENILTLTGPVLIAVAIDTGIPDAVDGDTTVLVWCVGAYLVSGLGSAATRFAFLKVAGRFGQDVLLDLRQRIFRHAQRLSISFHEKYTSGKVISRMTSDVDSLHDLLEDGLDGLLTAVLSVVGITAMLLVLDVPLALIVLAGLIPLIWVTRWFYVSSRRAYRDTRGSIAKIIVQFVETMNGMRAVQAFRREDRNEQIMAELNDRFRGANKQALIVVARFTMTVRLGGQPVAGAGAGDRRTTSRRRQPRAWRADGVHPVPAPVLRPAGRAGDVRQLVHVGDRRAGEDLGRAGGGADGGGAGGAGEPAVAGHGPRDRLRRGGVPVLGDDAGGAADVRPAHPRRSDSGFGGRDGRGQVDDREAGRPFLRPVRRRCAAGRRVAT